MALARHLALIMAVLLGLPTAASAERARPASPQTKARVAQQKPVRRVTRPRAARPSSDKPIRRTIDRARDKVMNSAPAGKTPLERELQTQLDRIIADDPSMRAAVNGIYIVDMTSGEVLYSFGGDRQLNPASNVKLVSTAAALDALGSEWSYQTRLLGPAPDADGVVKGDVFFSGAGDPTLKHKDFADLAASLSAAGVTRVTGDLVISSNAQIDALPRTQFTVVVTGGAAEGDLPTVTVSPDSAFFVVDTTAISTARVPASITKGKRRRKHTIIAPKLSVGASIISTDGGERMRVSVSGKLRPGQRVSYSRNVMRPALFTAHTARAHALLGGIAWHGGVRVSDKPIPVDELAQLGVHRSAPLETIIAWINKPSNNYLADRIIETVGSQLYGGRPSRTKAVQAMSDYLAKIGVEQGTYLLENGSGLSHSNHLSARQVAQVLLSAVKDGRLAEHFVDSLAIGGVDGTLRGRFRGRPTEGRVHGKTGTLNGVAALSGFVTDSDGHQICFAILTNGFRNARKLGVRAAQVRLVDTLHAYLEARDASAGEITRQVQTEVDLGLDDPVVTGAEPDEADTEGDGETETGTDDVADPEGPVEPAPEL